jgi:hypothetical protein
MNEGTPDSGVRATAHASGSRWRRITAGILLALAVLAIILGPIMLYVRSQFLDSNAFRDRAETALASPAVQAYVADAITANLVARGGPQAQRAEPLVRAVAGGVVASDQFEAVFGRAVLALHTRLLSESTAPRLVRLKEATDRVVTALAVVRPQLAQRIRDASGQIAVGGGATGKRLAQIAHLAQRLRVLGIILPIVGFLLIALSVLVAPDRLRGARRAGWALIAGGIVVTAVSAVTHRVLTGLVDGAELRLAVGDAEDAFLGDLGTWGAWVVAIGVVVLGTAVFLERPLTVRERVTEAWSAGVRRPTRTWALVLKILAVVAIVLLAIFAIAAVLKTLVGVLLGLAVAFALAELLRRVGVGARRPRAGVALEPPQLVPSGPGG